MVGDFEKAVIAYGVEEACLWFGYKRGDPFIAETEDVLRKEYPEMFAPKEESPATNLQQSKCKIRARYSEHGVGIL